MRHVTRREMLRGLVGAAGVGVLTACAGTAAPAATTGDSGSTTAAATTAPAQTEEKIKMVHSEWGDPESAWGKYYAHYIEKFQEQNPNVTIEYQSVPWADYHTKLLTQIAGGTAPDTFAHSNVYYPKFVAKGGALEIQPFIDATPDFGIDDFLPTSLRLSTYKGKLYGMPHISSAWTRIYNKEKFAELGIPDPNEQDAAGEWNWESFLDAAMKGTVRDSEGKAESLGFGAPGLDYLTCHQWMWQNNGNMLSQPDMKEFAGNSAESAEAVQFQGDLINKYKVSPAAGEILVDTVSDFNNGRILMFDSWANMDYLGFAQFEFGDIVYPAAGKERITILHTNSLGIYSKTKYPDTAWQFVALMTSPEGDLDQVNFGGGIVLRKSNLPKMTEINRSKYHVEHPEVVEEVIATGRTYDITEMYSEITTIYNAAMDQITNGERPAAEVMEEIKPQIDGELAKIEA